MLGAMTSEDEAAWIDLEREVASLYRSLGYAVERDELLRHSQIDLVVTRPVAGTHALRLAIEVKYRSRGLVPIIEVRAFLDTARDLLNAGVISGAVLVSNTGVSRNARALARDDHRFYFLTLEDLRRTLIFNDDHIKRWIRSYEATQVSARFVDVRLEPQDRVSGPPAKHITDLLEAFESTTAASSIVILADYGGGKTTGLERLKYIAFQRYLQNAEKRLPILFQLKTLVDFPDFTGFIQQSLQRELATQCDLGTFWQLVAESRFVFLFDGFDEIAVQPTARERAGYLAKIAPLFFGQCPAILSSRPSYFANKREYARLVNLARSARGLTDSNHPARNILGPTSERLFSELRNQRAAERGEPLPTNDRCDTYSVLPLDEGQIRAYVEKLTPEFARVGISDPAHVLRFLDEVYDLSDLVTRPILLQMITETILRGAVNIYSPAEDIGPAELYEVYTELRLVDDFDKGPVRQRGLTTVQRRSFAEWCAWRMNGRGILVLSNREAAELSHKVVQPRSNSSLTSSLGLSEKVMTDLRTCSFLTVNDDGGLRFIHKSFLEFFLASRLREVLLQDKDLSDIAQTLPNETMYFLGAMTHSLDNVRAQSVYDAIINILERTDRPQDAGKGRDSQIRYNLLGSLLYGRESVDSVSIRSCRAPRVVRKRLSLKRVRFEDVIFEDLSVGVVTIDESVIKSCAIGGRLGTLTVRNSELYLEVSRFERLSLDGCVGRLEAGRLPREPISIVGGSSITIAPNDGADRLRLDTSDSIIVVEGIRRSVEAAVHRCILQLPPPSATVATSTGPRISATKSIIVVLSSSSNAGVLDDPSDGAFTGALVDCIVLVHPNIPLSAVRRLKIENCVILGGYIEAAEGREENGRNGMMETSSTVVSFVRSLSRKRGTLSGLLVAGRLIELDGTVPSLQAKLLDHLYEEGVIQLLKRGLSEPDWSVLRAPLVSLFDFVGSYTGPDWSGPDVLQGIERTVSALLEQVSVAVRRDSPA